MGVFLGMSLFGLGANSTVVIFFSVVGLSDFIVLNAASDQDGFLQASTSWVSAAGVRSLSIDAESTPGVPSPLEEDHDHHLRLSEAQPSMDGGLGVPSLARSFSVFHAHPHHDPPKMEVSTVLLVTSPPPSSSSGTEVATPLTTLSLPETMSTGARASSSFLVAIPLDHDPSSNVPISDRTIPVKHLAESVAPTAHQSSRLIRLGWQSFVGWLVEDVEKLLQRSGRAV